MSLKRAIATLVLFVVLCSLAFTQFVFADDAAITKQELESAYGIEISIESTDPAEANEVLLLIQDAFAHIPQPVAAYVKSHQTKPLAMVFHEGLGETCFYRDSTYTIELIKMKEGASWTNMTGTLCHEYCHALQYAFIFKRINSKQLTDIENAWTKLNNGVKYAGEDYETAFSQLTNEQKSYFFFSLNGYSLKNWTEDMANVFAHSLLERSASQYRKKDQFLAALIIETLKLPDNTFDHVLSNNLTLSARGPSLRLGNIPDLSKYEYVWVNVWAEGDPPNGSRNAAKSGRGVVAGDEVSFDVGGLTPGSYYFGFFGYDKDGAETYLHFSQTALFKWDGSQLEIPGTATTDDRDRHLDELRAILTGQPMNSGIDSSLTANARAIPSGGNSVQTSVAISQQGWESASTVIIAPSAEKNLIDALAVAPLAGQEGAPVLLNSGDVLDPAVAEEIQRLGVRKIIAVGALTNEFIANVKTLLPDVEVELLRGVDRWHTANLINAKITNPNGVFIVGCKAAPDSVSAASWAAANGFVIQLAQPDGSLSPALSSFLSAIPSAYILGGPALVKNIPGVARLYGADRFQTNQAVLNALSYDHSIVYTVDGYALAEGIAGSVLAAKTKSPLVLIK